MDNPLLHVELLPGDQMNFKIKGDPVIVTKMIRTAMQARQDIAAAMIASVSQYCIEQNIPLAKLHELVILPKKKY